MIRFILSLCLLLHISPTAIGEQTGSEHSFETTGLFLNFYLIFNGIKPLAFILLSVFVNFDI